MSKQSRPQAIHVAVAVLLSAAAPFAAALPSVSASSNISNVQFHTADLTPGDGQAGGISGLRANGELSARFGQVSDNHPYQAVQAASAAVADHFTSAAISQSGTPGEMAAQAEAHGYDHARAEGRQQIDFLLLPHTALSITGHIAGAVHQDPGLPYSWGMSSVWGELNLDLWHTVGGVSKTISVFGPKPDPVYSQDFAVNYANDTDAAIAMYWYVNTYADASSGINAPVPEPAGFAMLGIGLPLIGLAVRRRQHRRPG